MNPDQLFEESLESHEFRRSDTEGDFCGVSSMVQSIV